jgi:glucose/arabinose dehydrogenase
MRIASAFSGRKSWVLVGLAVCVVVATYGLYVVSTQSSVDQNTPKTTLKTPIIWPEFLVGGLSAPTAIVATPAPADKRLFVLERAGTVRVVTPNGTLAPTAFLDIRDKVLGGGEMGLLGMAFHPAYTNNGYFYIHYIDKNQNTVVARYEVSAQPDSADPASEQVLLQLKQPYANHNGGDLAFGPDGYLYVAMGDGGSAGDPDHRAQNQSSLFGKILRVDVDRGSPYGIPPSNPYVAKKDVKTEIWASGLRNPWRMSFDKSTGDLYIADVGQGEREEVNVQEASSKGGENYGWRCYEGNKGYNLDGCGDVASFVLPAFEYNHAEKRCSITGGYVYRGTANPALTGKYVYGDFCNGQLFYAEQKNGEWQQTLAATVPYMISTFGQGSDGELYLADFKGGSLYRLADAAN